MTDDVTLQTANQIEELMGQFWRPGAEQEIAIEIAQALPLEVLEREGVEAILEVAANLSLGPRSYWELQQEIKCLKLHEIMHKRRRAGGLSNE